MQGIGKISFDEAIENEEELSAIQRRFDDDLHGGSVSTRSRGNGAEAKDEKLGLVDGSFQPRSIQLLSRVLSQLGYARVSRYQIYFLDEESSSLPGSSIRRREGMLDLPRRCTFLTRLFRFSLLSSFRRCHLYRYRLYRPCSYPSSFEIPFYHYNLFCLVIPFLQTLQWNLLIKIDDLLIIYSSDKYFFLTSTWIIAARSSAMRREL